MRLNKIRSCNFPDGMSTMELELEGYAISLSVDNPPAQLVPSTPDAYRYFEGADVKSIVFVHHQGLEYQMSLDNVKNWLGECALKGRTHIRVYTNRSFMEINVVDHWGHFTPSTINCIVKENDITMKEPLTIKIKYHEDKYGEMTKLERIDQGDWIDLRAAETVEMKKGEFKLISLGVSMQFPPGYEAHMATRSSTYKTWGILLANSHSIIDESYNGDNDIWLFPALAMRDTIIKKGDRIAQFRLVEKMPAVEFEEVQTLGNPDRGGIGSTGKK